MASKTLLCLVLVVACAAGAGAQQQPTGAWASEASGAYYYYGAIVNDGTYAYLVAGYQTGAGNAGGAYRAIRRYDLTADTFTNLADVPVNMYLIGGAFYNGSIYTFGNGYAGSTSTYWYFPLQGMEQAAEQPRPATTAAGARPVMPWSQQALARAAAATGGSWRVESEGVRGGRFYVSFGTPVGQVDIFVEPLRAIGDL